MKHLNNNDYITITKKEYISENSKLNILSGVKIVIKEKNEDYIILESNNDLTEVKENGTINLLDAKKELKINKGESKKITLAATDYVDSVIVKY